MPSQKIHYTLLGRERQHTQNTLMLLPACSGAKQRRQTHSTLDMPNLCARRTEQMHTQEWTCEQTCMHAENMHVRTSWHARYPLGSSASDTVKVNTIGCNVLTWLSKPASLCGAWAARHHSPNTRNIAKLNNICIHLLLFLQGWLCFSAHLFLLERDRNCWNDFK